MTGSFEDYRDTPLWRALASALADLQVSREVEVHTAPDYVIAYLCQELAAKRIVVLSALARES